MYIIVVSLVSIHMTEASTEVCWLSGRTRVT